MILSALILAAVSPLTAKTLYVHAQEGRDHASGAADAPLRSLNEAVALARPGDVIQLIEGQAPIGESIVIANRAGKPGEPITLEGEGNELIGTAPMDAGEWKEIHPGLYKNTSLMERLAGKNPRNRAAVLARFFLVINGALNRMDRSSKGVQPLWPDPSALQPGQWTADPGEGTLYFRAAQGKPLTDYAIEAPVRSNGLTVQGESSHWIIRNLRATRFWNDGFNFHGNSKDIRLENVSALECGDDGMSAHEQCEVAVDGFLARGNSTGICHIGHSSSKNRAVDLRDNHGWNLCVLGDGTHEFSDSIIGRGIRAGRPNNKESVTLRFLNCRLPEGENSIQKGPSSHITIE